MLELAGRLHNSMKQLRVSADQLIERARSSSREIINTMQQERSKARTKKGHSVGRMPPQPQSARDLVEKGNRRLVKINKNMKLSQSFSSLHSTGDK